MTKKTVFVVYHDPDPPWPMEMLKHKLVISAPFGNYMKGYHASVRTLGTFTLVRRGGWLWRIFRVLWTVRYLWRIQAWVNKLGLPNPGIKWLLDKVERGHNEAGESSFSVYDKIISIKGFSIKDWRVLINNCVTIEPFAIELNMSCPNVEGYPPSHYKELFEYAHEKSGGKIIVKLPPVGYGPLLGDAYAAGIRYFHCCNTLPVPAGGMSGVPLRPVSLEVVRPVKRLMGTVVIGGGGIFSLKDAEEYLMAGADSVAIASMLFNPFSGGRVREIGSHMINIHAREVIPDYP